MLLLILGCVVGNRFITFFNSFFNFFEQKIFFIRKNSDCILNRQSKVKMLRRNLWMRSLFFIIYISIKLSVLKPNWKISSKFYFFVFYFIKWSHPISIQLLLCVQKVKNKFAKTFDTSWFLLMFVTGYVVNRNNHFNSKNLVINLMKIRYSRSEEP